MKGNYNTMSDLSTTVAPQSLQNDIRPTPFLDAAAGVIDSTPNKFPSYVTNKKLKKDWLRQQP